MRKIVVSVILLTLLAATGFGYLYLKNSRKTATNAIQSIPVDALFVWEVNDLFTTWNHLAHNSILWEELSYSTSIQAVDVEVNTWDSIFFTNEEAKEWLDEKPLFLSWHPTGKSNSTWLATISLPNGSNQSSISKLFSIDGQQVQSHQVEEYNIYTARVGTYTYHYGIADQILFLSPNAELIERAHQQSSNISNLLTNESFIEVYQTAGNSPYGVLFFGYNRLPRAMQPFVEKALLADNLSDIQQLGAWCAQDVDLKSNAIMLSGFSTYSDSLHHTLGWFEGQQAEDHELDEVLPFNTAAFIHYGFSNLPAWYERKRADLENQELLFEHDHVIANLENEYGFSYQKHLLNWIEHEVAVGFIEGRSDQLNDKVFAITKASNISLAEKHLTELRQRTSLLIDETPTLLDSSIHYVGIPNLLGPIFGYPFDLLTNSYYTIIDKYVIWANNQQLLREIRAQQITEQTLAESDAFNQLEEQISEESNIFIYLNIARSTSEMKHALTSAYEPKSENDIAFLRKFQAVAYQWSFERKGLFYTHGYFVHNPVYKEATYSLWELALEAPSTMKPVVVKNHYTNANEVFIQDQNNTIYLISNSGKVLWKRKLSEPILSDIYQIDVYANSKLQLLFNTRSKVFLIDRNGHDVPGYSIELPEKATTGLTVIDYSGNHKYRILVPAEGGNLYNYDNDGKLVGGWKHKAEKANIIRAVKYFSIKNKDYLLAELANGQVVGYDRRGRIRLKHLPESITQRPSESFLSVGTTLKNTYLIVSDSSGTVYRLFLDGSLQKADYGSYSPNHQFKVLDLNNDGSNDYLFADKGEVIGMDEDGEELLSIELDKGDITSMNAYQFDQGYSIGVSLADENEIYLFDRTEQLQPFFPMDGVSPFTITDLNKDGQFNLLVVDQSGILYAYLLEQ